MDNLQRMKNRKNVKKMGFFFLTKNPEFIYNHSLFQNTTIDVTAMYKTATTLKLIYKMDHSGFFYYYSFGLVSEAQRKK